MKIAVNTRMLIRGKMEGIGYFTFETMKRMVKSHPEHEFIFIFDRPFDSSFIFAPNVTGVVVPPPARHPILWTIWLEYSLRKFFRKNKVDLFIGTDGYLPLSIQAKTLAVFHDINFEHYPKDLPFFNRIYYRYFFPRFAKKADRIIAVSEFTRKDVIEKYHVDEKKTATVYNGVSDAFAPISADQISTTRNKFTQGLPYFLFVGSLHQRKNIANLLRAFELFKNTTGSKIKLVLAGAKRWWTSEMEQVHASMLHRNDVIFTGRLSFEELTQITASALAVTYVSTFEGFGIPIVEAMKSGVPVITSNVTSMPEIAGDATLLCDPFSVESISNAMQQIASSEALRKALIEKGILRAKDFSWEKTAEGVWGVLNILIS